MSNVHRFILGEVYLRDYSRPCGCGYDKCETLKMRGKLQAALNIPKDIAQARFEGYPILRVKSTGQKAYALSLKQEESPYRKKRYLTIHIENGVPEEVKIDNLMIEVTPPTKMIPDSAFVSLAENLEMITDA